MDKIVVSTQELESVPRTLDMPGRVEPKLPSPIPWWAKVAFWPLVLALPLLCLLTIILRVSTRNQPPRVKHAWTAFLSTLLIVSGFLTSAAAVLSVSLVPLPAVVSRSLSDLDERTLYPRLPASTAMNGMTVASELKPQVAVITPARRMWFSGQESASGILGAGILLQANAKGYLFATARHVVDGLGGRWGADSRALVAMASGAWAGADVVARHASLDLAVLWVPRESGHSDFVQPIASVSDGQDIFVIGHPEGLKFTISNGMVSRVDQTSLFQISAPVSPGNSGGPVFDKWGNLVGIVVFKMDKSVDPNAENLNFAVRADALLRDAGWLFARNGRQLMTEFASSSAGPGRPASTSPQTPTGAANTKNGNH